MGPGGVMRKAWTGALLGLGLLASAGQAQPPGDKAGPPAEAESRWGRWVRGGGREKDDEKKLTADAERSAAASAGQRALDKDLAMKAYLRRLAVCDRLREIARDTNDQALVDEVERLESAAWRICQSSLSAEARARPEPESEAARPA